ncbi:MAG: YggS family pyridoxal phosphate-dependent enzyme [Gemmataceae bacterium]|nr:YggS family pyridoxal phosphate-dependent enzyme [Gemmataceae bacterium]
MDASVRQKLRANLVAVEKRIASACARAGRQRYEVTLLAVTKTVSAEVAALLPEMEILDLAENRPQHLWAKVGTLPPEVRWHLIGHLQRNKIEKTLPLVHEIHSVDSIRLLQALEEQATTYHRTLPVLLEVNASGETSKHGFTPAELPDLVPTLRELKHVQVRGLMTMAALQEPEACRPTFVAMGKLRNQMRTLLVGSHAVEHLSMGMSNDFEIAIEEGATFIRLGSVLFEGIRA